MSGREPVGRGTGDAAAVHLTGVGKRYGAAWAVRDLDLVVGAGEFVSLLGPSGCGKTTTLRMIGGFERPDTGAIAIGDRVMGDLPPHRRPVNTVFQSYALFPHMTVADNVAYGLRLQRVPKAELRERVSAALDTARMRSFADRKPAQLSGGQQQRVALARALVNRPGALLLDEPMSALDRKLREELQVELKLLQHELGITFVLVTHDQGEALTMSDRIAVMHEGRLEQFGTSGEVYDDPASAFVAGFIGQQNFLTGRIAGIERDGLVVDTADGPLAVRAEVRGGAAAVGAPVRLAVRPEAVRVAPHDGADGVRGVLRGVSQVGHLLNLVVATVGGAQLIAAVPRADAPPTTLGTDVVCTWPADGALLFADGPAPEPAAPRGETVPA